MRLWARLKNTFHPSALKKDAEDELSWHLEQRTNEYFSRGMPIDQARDKARQQLGNVTLLEEDTAERDVLVWLELLKRDLILALRMLRRTPTVTAIAVLSLALGIGANTVVFTLMKQVVLDYLPVPEADRLVILHSHEPEMGHSYTNGMNSSYSYPLYRDLNADTSSIFDGILALRTTSVNIAGRDAVETVKGDMVSGNFFQVLRVTPWRGRLFTPDDDSKPGAHPVVVLGYGLWKRSFGGDSGIVNQTILINQHRYTVVGIAPPQFYGIDVGRRSDVFLPIAMKDEITPGKHLLEDRLDHWCSLLGRLKPAVSIEQASTALAAIYPPLRDLDIPYMKTPSPEFKRNFAKKKIDLTPGGKGYADLRDRLSKPLMLLTLMVGIVLLITVINIANLLIARGLARQREMAIRLSVGAGKAAVTRQLLAESLVLASIGGCLGIAMAYSGTPLLLHFLRFNLNERSLSARPDWHVMLFAGIVTLAAGFGFGLLPAWRSARTDVASALKTENSLGYTGQSVWLRRALVVGQIALSLVLLTTAMLFTRSLQNLKHLKLGFNTTHLVKFEINPQQAGYSQARIKSFGEQLRQQLANMPGVENAAVATVPVLEDDDEGGGLTVENANNYGPYLRNFVSPNYFATMQIRLIAGRELEPADSLPGSKVAVVNQTFVKHFLPGRNPLGSRFGLGYGNVPLDYTIVGLAGDSQHNSIRSPIGPFVYFPYLATNQLSSLTFYIRTRSGDQEIKPEIRQLVRRLDANLPVNGLTSITALIDESLFVERSLGVVSLVFAVLATLLAIVGLYGVMSYSVTRRYRELAIRMAVGASPRGILMMVLRESALLGIAGLVCAIPFVVATAGYIRSSLYGVRSNDPAVWFAAAALLFAIAVLAGFVPAWSAARIEPNVALRGE